jgi:hypothetical protein
VRFEFVVSGLPAGAVDTSLNNKRCVAFVMFPRGSVDVVAIMPHAGCVLLLLLLLLLPPLLQVVVFSKSYCPFCRKAKAALGQLLVHADDMAVVEVGGWLALLHCCPVELLH